MTEMNRTDVIIIGGGVAGLMSARELAGAGMRVVLLERQALAKESSWAGGGILSPLNPWRVAEPITTLCRWSQTVYPQLAEALHERTGVDPEWRQSGLLFGDCDDPAQASQWAEGHAIRLDRLSAAQVARIEPLLHPVIDNPVLLPDIAQVRNPRLLRALREDLTRLGVEMREHHPVDDIKVQQGRVVGVTSRQQTLTAESYVITAGAWSGLLMRNTGLLNLSVVPVKGEMLIFDAPPGLLSHMVLSRGRYLIPRRDGKILAGSTVENAQFNKNTSTAAQQILRDFAYELLPALRQHTIEKHWAGLRPGSPEGIPTIGAHPEIANLYFNCGHYRNGFVMAPASARLLADHVLRRPAIVPPEPYLPGVDN